MCAKGYWAKQADLCWTPTISKASEKATMPTKMMNIFGIALSTMVVDLQREWLALVFGVPSPYKSPISTALTFCKLMIECSCETSWILLDPALD